MSDIFNIFGPDEDEDGLSLSKKETPKEESLQESLKPELPSDLGVAPNPIVLSEGQSDLVHQSLREDNVQSDKRIVIPEVNLPASIDEKRKQLVRDAVKDMVLYGAEASAMICEGDACPYAKKCPLLRNNIPVPIGSECPIEIVAMKTWLQAQLRELEINPYDSSTFFDLASSQVVVGLMLQMNRARWGEALNPLLEQTLEQSITSGDKEIVNVIKTGNYNCVEANTPILKADLSWDLAKNIKEGEILLGFDEELNHGKGKERTRKWRLVKVLANSIEPRECLEITMENGDKIVCTPDHKWLTKKWISSSEPVWVETKDLTNSHYILKSSDIWQHDKSWESGWLAGFLDGDGCVSQGKLVGNQLPGETFKRAVKLAKVLHSGKVSTSGPSGTSPTHRLSILGRFADKMKLLGKIRPERLIKNWVSYMIGKNYEARYWVKVVDVKEIGVSSVAVMGTSEKTYIANGYSAHNTDYRERAIKLIEKMAKNNMQTRERKVSLMNSGWKDKSKHAAEVAERIQKVKEQEETIHLDKNGLPVSLSKIVRFKSEPDVDKDNEK